MNETYRPWLALSGVLFFILGLLGQIVAPELPDFAATTEEIVAFYEDEGTSMLGPAVLWMLTGAVGLVFVGFLRSVTGTAEGGDERLSAIAYAGGVAGGAIAIAGASLMAMSALRIEENGTIDPAVATVSLDYSNILYGGATPMALSVLVLAVAALCFKHGFLPSWMGLVSVVLGVALLAVPIAYIAVIVFNFWVLLVGGLVFLGRSRQASPRGEASVRAT